MDDNLGQSSAPRAHQSDPGRLPAGIQSSLSDSSSIQSYSVRDAAELQFSASDNSSIQSHSARNAVRVESSSTSDSSSIPSHLVRDAAGMQSSFSSSLSNESTTESAHYSPDVSPQAILDDSDSRWADPSNVQPSPPTVDPGIGASTPNLDAGSLTVDFLGIALATRLAINADIEFTSTSPSFLANNDVANLEPGTGGDQSPLLQPAASHSTSTGNDLELEEEEIPMDLEPISPNEGLDEEEERETEEEETEEEETEEEETEEEVTEEEVTEEEATTATSTRRRSYDDEDTEDYTDSEEEFVRFWDPTHIVEFAEFPEYDPLELDRHRSFYTTTFLQSRNWH